MKLAAVEKSELRLTSAIAASEAMTSAGGLHEVYRRSWVDFLLNYNAVFSSLEQGKKAFQNQNYGSALFKQTENLMSC